MPLIQATTETAVKLMSLSATDSTVADRAPLICRLSAIIMRSAFDMGKCVLRDLQVVTQLCVAFG